MQKCIAKQNENPPGNDLETQKKDVEQSEIYTIFG